MPATTEVNITNGSEAPIRKRKSSEVLDGYIHKFRLERYDGALLEIPPYATNRAEANWLYVKFVAAALIFSGLLVLGAGAIGG